jgi:hypothetical protein
VSRQILRDFASVFPEVLVCVISRNSPDIGSTITARSFVGRSLCLMGWKWKGSTMRSRGVAYTRGALVLVTTLLWCVEVPAPCGACDPGTDPLWDDVQTRSRERKRQFDTTLVVLERVGSTQAAGERGRGRIVDLPRLPPSEFPRLEHSLIQRTQRWLTRRQAPRRQTALPGGSPDAQGHGFLEPTPPVAGYGRRTEHRTLSGRIAQTEAAAGSAGGVGAGGPEADK